eukprot:g19182.t1
MGDVARLRLQSQDAQSDTQAFDYARSKAGDVTELFDILAGRLRPGRNAQGGGDGLGGTSLSSKSILKAQYHGSSGNTVLGMANLKRIQTFLDEPQRHLGQVIADIEKEAGSFYVQVSSRRQESGSTSGTGSQRMQRGVLESARENHIRRVCLEGVPEMNKYLGPCSRFGDGDGSFWDRWLTTTGHFTDQGNYAKADMPSRSMYSTGVVTPHSGFKRYQLDKLAFTREPDPRVLTYTQRRELGDRVKADETPKRLRGAYSEASLPPDGGDCLNEALLAKATEAFRTFQAIKDKHRTGAEGVEGRVQEELQGGAVAGGERTTRARSSREDPEVALAAVEKKLRTLGTAGATRTVEQRMTVSDATLKDEEDEGAAAGEVEGIFGTASNAARIASGDASRLQNGDFSLEKAIASLGLVHPNYFCRRARTHVYNYYKQVSRRRYQYGEPEAMSFIPLTPLDHTGTIPAYKAGVDAITSNSGASLDGLSQAFQGKPSSKGKPRQHQLPPLATNAVVAPGKKKEKRTLGSRESSAGEGRPKNGDSLSNAPGEDDQHDLTSRTRYLVRCMENNVAPRAHVIIRKTHTTKVNLAHQGMGDVMGGILADCLVGLPLMRELNLRDNRLTDKGLMPIVKAIKQRHDLYSLDLSENKLDRWAARELALYFSDRQCTLAKLILSKADVDDFEASNFVKHMTSNKTLTYLDLSHNLIGSQESINYVRPEFYTGAEALADWISTGSCPLKYLDISWNTIRLDSAVYFGNAVAYATDLEERDLSFNCFGERGGEAVGASLHVNTSLKTLRLASNALNPRACFVICQGLMQNSTIHDIDLSNNSLGKIGVGCVMALPAEVGDRLQIGLANCNFMVGCESCWFDDEQLRQSYDLRMDEPYDRAVAFHLIRRGARDEGLQLRRVAHTMAGESEKQVHLVDGVGPARRNFADKATREAVFRKYDQNVTGILDSEALGKVLGELNLSGDDQVDMLMTRHVDGNGRIEESEFHELLEEIAFQQKRREKRSKAFLAEESSVNKPWLVPPEGQLRLELEYQRLHNQGSHTSIESTDGNEDVHDLANAHGWRQDQSPGQGYSTDGVAKRNEARLLKNSVLRDLDERRKLRHELGPAYRPLMGTPMGHFELDLAKPMHRLAAQKILECNNLEKLARQSRAFSVFDASQRGDWNNTRNETLNGKPCRVKGTILDELPQAGTLGIDFTSSTRLESRSCHGAATVSRTKPMSTRKFLDFLRALGLGDDETWAGVVEVEVDGGLDRLVDKALHEGASDTWPAHFCASYE